MENNRVYKAVMFGWKWRIYNGDKLLKRVFSNKDAVLHFVSGRAGSSVVFES